MPLVDPKNKNQESFNPNVDNSQIAPNPNKFGIFLTYFSFILIIPIFIYIGTRNKLIKLQMRINEASSGIDVQLKKRKDTLIKLVDATKSSMKFEKSLIENVTKLRSNKSIKNDTDLANEVQKVDQINRNLNFAFENYPQIKSQKNIALLMEQATNIELEISATRRLYNSYINNFNQRLFTWPGTVCASGMKLVKLPLFAASIEDKKDVSLKMDVN